MTPRIEARLARVLAYVQKNSPVTARQVAQDMFGTSGRTRTSGRHAAYQALRRLCDRGLLVRVKADIGGFAGHRYEVPSQMS